MSAYYNEFDPFAAQWLRNLIAQNLIAPGDVDERSIVDVQPDDLLGYEQCHFFAGIGGWSYALRLAGWPDDEPAWTGSCPCQPFSQAGEKRGTEDSRHLWPEFYRLIRQRKPARVLGEQVASKDGYAWLDGVQDDLEVSGYACAAADLAAASVGSPHVRQRIFWVANSRSQDVQGFEPQRRDLRSIQSTTQSVNGHAVLLPWVSIRPDSVPTFDADGLPRPMGIVRGFGNAIVPQVAAEFIAAYMECRP